MEEPTRQMADDCITAQGDAHGNDEMSLEEIVSAGERLTPLFGMFMAPKAIQTEQDALIQRRKQLGSYLLIAAIVAAVSVLGYLEAIDRGATASILGAIAGHIFCRATNG